MAPASDLREWIAQRAPEGERGPVTADVDPGLEKNEILDPPV
jgi:hypothetical protein